MIRTVSIKLTDMPEGFLDFLKTCSLVFNEHVEWAFKNRSYDKVKAHKDLYQELRSKYNIPSSVLQATRDQALEAVKALKFKFKPTKKPYSAVRYNARTLALRGNLLTFSWSGKRIRKLINIPYYFRKYQGWKLQGATIGYCPRRKLFKCNLIFESQTPPILQEKSVLGVDRGLYNIVSLSDGSMYNAREIRKKKREFLFVKRQLQAKGTRSAKRLLRKRSGREKRFSLDVNHCISKQLANLSYDTFVIEDLTGIRNQKSKGKVLNGWLSNWSFWQLEQFLAYKLEGLGKKLVKVDARYTSQKCCACGNTDKKSRNKSQYKCVKCGHFEHADTNAAKNIRANYLLSVAEKSTEQAPVNEPNASVSETISGASPRL